MSAAKMPKIWEITHLVGPTKQDTILEYTNCTKLKEHYQDLFPKTVNEDEEKGKGDDRCVLIPVDDVDKYKYMYGKPGNIRALSDFICPEKDAWITPRLLSEMVKVHMDWLGEDEVADEILKTKEESERKEKEKLKDDAEGTPQR